MKSLNILRIPPTSASAPEPSSAAPSPPRGSSNTQPQALSCLLFYKDWLSGGMVFMHSCPAKSIFCSFFL